MGSGHAFDMIRSFKVNRGLLKKRRKLSHIREVYTSEILKECTSYKQATPQQLQKIRARLKNQQIQEKRRSLIILFFSILIPIIALTLVLRSTTIAQFFS